MVAKVCKPLTDWIGSHLRWVWGGAGIAMALLAWHYGPALWALARDEAALEQAMAELGWWGPLALVAINILQIVIAPIPGYVMQAAAGYLYGPFWGGVWGSLGLVAGAMLAMGLARTFGRPLVERLSGADRLARWERLTFSTSTVVWFVILIAPTGDLPYFMAGLARVSFWKIVALTLLIRVPSTFVVAAVGAGVWNFSGWQLAFMGAGLGALLVIFLRYQEKFTLAMDRRVQRRLTGEEPT